MKTVEALQRAYCIHNPNVKVKVGPKMDGVEPLYWPIFVSVTLAVILIIIAHFQRESGNITGKGFGLLVTLSAVIVLFPLAFRRPRKTIAEIVFDDLNSIDAYDLDLLASSLASLIGEKEFAAKDEYVFCTELSAAYQYAMLDRVAMLARRQESEKSHLQKSQQENERIDLWKLFSEASAFGLNKENWEGLPDLFKEIQVTTK